MIFDISTQKVNELLKDSEHGVWLREQLFANSVYPEDESNPVAWVVTDSESDIIDSVFANRADAKEYVEHSKRNMNFEAVDWVTK